MRMKKRMSALPYRYGARRSFLTYREAPLLTIFATNFGANWQLGYPATVLFVAFRLILLGVTNPGLL